MWAPKYGTWVGQGAVRERVRELFLVRAEHQGFEMEESEVATDHVQVFLSVPPKYSIGQVVTRWKAVSAQEGREFWEDG